MKLKKKLNQNRKPKLTSSEHLVMLSSLYVVLAVTMNIFCMKALSFGTSIIICDAGLLISWGVFLIANVITEVWDERTAVRLSSFTAAVALAVMLLARLIVVIPTLDGYREQADAFAMVFSNGPRTIVASVVAFWVGNLINTHIIYKGRIGRERKGNDNRFFFFLRAAFSTLVGQFADNSLFMFLAFAPVGLSLYEMDTGDIISAVLAGTAIELSVEALFVPLITMPLTEKLKALKKKEAV